ncbi:hypothetical protein GALMADRAFT_1252074 [Galerina marginata CBS 339.88]|uniref:Uncharacterized protein n=1 Tax=Galerina marginata (strain CBS 339.88) TaxID=685588 RepID=A0A067T5P2_GALM3|nr:hypothetical protein GALMADRAFT_1252074 [Galerina marginata CBS 339.88]
MQVMFGVEFASPSNTSLGIDCHSTPTPTPIRTRSRSRMAAPINTPETWFCGASTTLDNDHFRFGFLTTSSSDSTASGAGSTTPTSPGPAVSLAFVTDQTHWKPFFESLDDNPTGDDAAFSRWPNA